MRPTAVHGDDTFLGLFHTNTYIIMNQIKSTSFLVFRYLPRSTGSQTNRQTYKPIFSGGDLRLSTFRVDRNLLEAALHVRDTVRPSLMTFRPRSSLHSW